MRAIVAVAVLASSIAHAEAPTIDSAFPPTLRVERPTAGVAVERIAIGGGELTWVTLQLRSVRRSRATELAFDLPLGARVIGIELARFDTPFGGAGSRAQSPTVTTVWGGPVAAAHGVRRYRDAGAPALVEYRGASGDVAHHLLRVEAVATGRPTRVTLAVELPTMSLAIATSAPVFVDGHPRTGPIAIAGSPTRDYAGVDAETSLLADTVENDTPRSPVIGAIEEWSDDVGRNPRRIRRTVKDHMAQLGRCYTLELQRAPQLEGNAVLHFVIAPNASVLSATADGTLPSADVLGCLARAAATWTFSEDAGLTVVNYPINFKHTR